GVPHGTTRTCFHPGESESERPDRQGRRSGKNDQAGHSRHAEPAAAGEGAGGDRDRRPARAREKAERQRGESGGVDAQGGTRGRQERRRPGAGLVIARRKLPRAQPELHPTGGRPESASGKSEERPAPVGAEAYRSASQGGRLDRAASPRSSRRESQ